ncbi:hypothetical protein ACH5RR_023326 [Cinchona calisaya]|uniref:Uncharacterized protein n=1 Tax=Cinchona calisaya TaxID=153742 RepID=A0ABD2ZBG5_9GENT
MEEMMIQIQTIRLLQEKNGGRDDNQPSAVREKSGTNDNHVICSYAKSQCAPMKRLLVKKIDGSTSVCEKRLEKGRKVAPRKVFGYKVVVGELLVEVVPSFVHYANLQYVGIKEDRDTRFEPKGPTDSNIVTRYLRHIIDTQQPNQPGQAQSSMTLEQRISNLEKK